ncbi:MAG: hypothetical protein AB7K52_01510 [Phycisphaerales bacterium]
MSVRGSPVAIHIDGAWLSAIESRAGEGGRGVEVVRCLVARRPADVEAADAKGVGAWVARELEGAKMLAAAKRGVVFAAARGEVAVKRIVVPPGASMSELPGLVRLQMVRQLPVAGDSAAIDFVPMDGQRAGLPGEAGVGEGSAVLAAALPAERLAWRMQVADAAGIRLRRVGLLAEGTAWVLHAVALGRTGAVMGVAVGPGAIELVVVEQGRLMFARGIECARPADPEQIDAAAAALLVEARRTWMSYRVAAESSEIEEIVVMGDDEFAARCAARLGEGLEMPARMIVPPASITLPQTLGSVERAAALPLAGLLAQEEREALDFVSPRRPVDVASRRRRVALVGMLAGVLCVGAAYTWTSREISWRETEASLLRNRHEEVRRKHHMYLRERARVEFLERYLANRADWIAHLNLVTAQLPETRLATLDELRGSMAGFVAFDLPKDSGKRFVQGKWRPATTVTIEISGSSKGRAVADELRERIQNDSTYKVETRGADVPNHFEYVLTTGIGVPGEAGAGGGGGGGGGGNGAKSSPAGERLRGAGGTTDAAGAGSGGRT